MSEPSGKRLKTNLPICKTHRVFVGSKVKQNLPAVVEESLCGVSTLIMEIAYRFEALVRVSVELIGIYQTSLYYLSTTSMQFLQNKHSLEKYMWKE